MYNGLMNSIMHENSYKIVYIIHLYKMEFRCFKDVFEHGITWLNVRTSSEFPLSVKESVNATSLLLYIT